MSDAENARASPSVTDGDGVRVVRGTRSIASRAYAVVAVVAVAGGIAVMAWPRKPAVPPSAGARVETPSVPVTPVSVEALPAPVTVVAPPPAPVRAAPVAAMASEPGPDDLPSGDPNDLATYVSADDPEPTAAEVIQALHDIGDHTGIGAFNPPGTSPALRGIAVPEEFALPPGYVRHHQVTDGGEPLEPILMFSPDVVFLDASGRNVPIPENRVVPPDMAPPGLPIRVIDIPPEP